MAQTAFLNQSEDIKTSYLVIMGAIATADHDNSEAEVAFMEQMSIAAGLSEDSRAQIADALKNTANVNLIAHLEKFKTNDLKFALVTDLLNLSYKDGELEASEIDAIKKINTVLGVSDEQYEALQQYIKAANKEASNDAGNTVMDANGQPKEQKTNFLDRIGLTDTFKKLGIPTDNFLTGSTIAVVLSSAAYMLWQNYMASQQKGTAQNQGSGNMVTSLVGNLISSALSGGQQTTPANQQQGGGVMQMVSGFLTSQAGQATINSVLSNVMSSTSKGNGLGNLMGMIGGMTNQNNQQQSNPLGNILSSFLK